MSRQASLGIVVAVLLAALAGFAWWTSSPAISGSAEPLAIATPPPIGEEAAVAPVAVVPASRAPAPEVEPEPAPPVASTASADAQPAEAPDLAARLPLEIVVVDEQGQPVFDAAIRVDGMRSASDPGSWYQFRGEPAVARTDPQGRARIDYWTWVDVDGKTISVDLNVTHAEFVPFRDSSFEVGPGERRVVLQRGAVVSVRAWLGSPNRIVEDIQIELEREASLGQDAWTRESDGRLVTTRIAPGQHLVRVTHRPKEAGAKPLFSEIEAFDLRAGERVDLAIELHAALELAGKLDDSVPRPVASGKVMLTIQEGGKAGSGTCLGDIYNADVRADGTFTFQDLPRGRGYVFALAKDAVSKTVRPATLAEAGITLAPGASKVDEERALRDLGDRSVLLQRAEVPSGTTPFVVEMQPTGSVEVLVTGPDGRPVAEANVDVSPNVRIPVVGSILVPWRDWNGRADALGIARFDDLPPDPSLWISAGAKGLQMRAADRKDTPRVVVKPGEVARITIQLEPVEPPITSAPK
ncbi:MAG: carboxypeptidase-like regulatory domain-containing protein [Planctomycetota bacterium]|nr:carboxypeptidase-like regulatory domain-containing protein [Planctomycetota bacterium]